MRLDYDILEEQGFLIGKLFLANSGEQDYHEFIASHAVPCGFFGKVQLGRFMYGKMGRIWPLQGESLDALEKRFIAELRAVSYLQKGKTPPMKSVA